MAVSDLDSFLFTGNQVYIAQLYERYLDDPGSVDPKWQDSRALYAQFGLDFDV